MAKITGKTGRERIEQMPKHPSFKTISTHSGIMKVLKS
jgi:hypothetical protein